MGSRVTKSAPLTDMRRSLINHITYWWKASIRLVYAEIVGRWASTSRPPENLNTKPADLYAMLPPPYPIWPSSISSYS